MRPSSFSTGIVVSIILVICCSFSLGQSQPAPELDVSALLLQIKDKDPLIRWRAVASLQWTLPPAQQFDVMRNALQDPHPIVRKTAARALGWLGDNRATALLLRLLNDNDNRVAAAAAEGLGQLRDPKAVTGLTAALPDSYGQKRDALCTALVTIGAPSIDALGMLARDKNPDNRDQAVDLLGRIADQHTIPLLHVALNDPQAHVRTRAADSLIEQRIPAGITAVLDAYHREKDDSTRQELLISLGKADDARCRSLILHALEDERTASAAGASIRSWGPESLESLLTTLQNIVSHEATRHDALARYNVLQRNQPIVDQLAQIGDLRAIPILASALKTFTLNPPKNSLVTALVHFGPAAADAVFPLLQDHEARPAALAVLAQLHDHRALGPLLHDLGLNEDRVDLANALGELGDSQAVPALLKCVLHQKQNEPDDGIDRSAIIFALARLHDRRIEPALLQVIDDPDIDVSTTACTVLGNMGNAQAIAHLANLVRGGNRRVRQLALQSLCAIRHSNVLATLIALLHENNIEEKGQLASELVKFHDRQSVPALLQLLYDADAAIRSSALTGLSDSRDPHVLAIIPTLLLDTDAQVRITAISELPMQSPGDCMTLLLPLLRDKDGQVVEWAQRRLLEVQAPDPHTTATLLQLLTGKSTDEEKQVAIDHLGKLKETRAVEALIALTEPSMEQETYANLVLRESAVRALGNIGDQRVMPALLRLVREDLPGDSEPDLRSSAIMALGIMRDSRALHPLTISLGYQYTELKQTAVRALGVLGDSRAIAVLSPLRQAPDRWTRLAVAIALARLGDAQQLSLLLDLLTHTRDNAIREILLGELANFHDTRVTDTFITLLHSRDGWVQQYAMMRLLEWKETRAIHPLIELLGSDDNTIHRQAAEALYAITGEDFGEDATQWQVWANVHLSHDSQR